MTATGAGRPGDGDDEDGGNGFSRVRVSDIWIFFFGFLFLRAGNISTHLQGYGGRDGGASSQSKHKTDGCRSAFAMVSLGGEKGSDQGLATR